MFDFPDQSTLCQLPYLSVGGRLERFLPDWERLPRDEYVIETIARGHLLPFMKNSKPTFRGVKYTCVAKDKMIVLLEEVKKLLDKGAIQQLHHSQIQMGFYSHYFLVTKKTGEFRPIINLKELNQTLIVPSFKMESIRTITMALQSQDYMASLDLKDAYFHVPIAKKHQKYLRFAILDKAYQYKVLPFGLSSSPRVFTKVLSPVIAKIRLLGVHIYPYLDDLLIRAQSQERLKESVKIAIESLISVGFVINLKKSETIPVQNIEYIGGVFNTREEKVSLPLRRVQALIKIVKSMKVGQYKITIFWLKILGVMASTIFLVKNARLRLRPIQLYFLAKWKGKQSMNFPIIINNFVFQHLQWWIEENNLLCALPLFPPHHQVVITTDASLDGWGGFVDMNHMTQGMWNNHQKSFHINNLELLAVELTLKRFVDLVKNKIVLIRSDNITTCFYINKSGGTKSLELCSQTWNLMLWCINQGIELRAVFLPGISNCVADSLSRFRKVDQNQLSVHIDGKEWSLDQTLIDAVFLALESPQVDLFATVLNKKLPIFCSLTYGKGEYCVDAMSINWERIYGYAFPPIPMIPRIIRKVRKDKAIVLLIAPIWPRRSWYSDLLDLLCHPPILIPIKENMLFQKGVYHNNPQFLKLAAWKLSGKDYLIKEFRKNLSTLFYQQGPIQPKEFIMDNGSALQIGVIQGLSIPLFHL